MPTVITRDHYLEVNGIPLATPGWEVPTLEALFEDQTTVGGDRPLPGGNVVMLPRQPTATTYTFPLNIWGSHDHEGNVNDDVIEGLIVNRDYLRANLGHASQTGDGTVEVYVHQGTLPALFGMAHFLGFKGARDIGEGGLRVTFDLKVDADGLTPEASSS